MKEVCCKSCEGIGENLFQEEEGEIRKMNCKSQTAATLDRPIHTQSIIQIDGIVQERRNSSALAMELRLSWTYPSK